MIKTLALTLLFQFNLIGESAPPFEFTLIDAPVTVPNPPRTVVTALAPSWCSGCKVAEREADGNGVVKFQWVHDERSFPAWVHNLPGGPTYPIMTWKVNGKSYYKTGWEGLHNFLKTYDNTWNLAAQNAPQEAAPTPGQEVERVIGLLPKPEIGFVDFGCGDARWCIAAAERWGCRVTGVEIDPARAAAARERVRSVGLDHLITIIEGDATTTKVEADVGVAYLYPDVLERLRPRLQRLRAFASYIHRPPGLAVSRNGDTWIYVQTVRPVQSFIPIQQPAYQYGVQYRGPAKWRGQVYLGRVCDNPNCRMCNSIQRQLGL